VVEYLIFEKSESEQLLRQKEVLVISTAIIQLIQAKILVIELQVSQAKVEIKTRIRVQRLPALIFVIRSLNLTKLVNDIVLDGYLVTLEGYLQKETLVRLAALSIPSHSNQDLLMESDRVMAWSIFLMLIVSSFITHLPAQTL
jgi:hypothetical protein